MIDVRLLGMTFEELKSQQVGGEQANFVDALPFVWNKFEQAGYVTLYADGGLNADDTFHMDFHGFEQPPVHHYMRPFWRAAADRQTTSSRRHRGCLGPLPEYKYVLRYVDRFLSVTNSSRDATSYPANTPRFAFAFVSGSTTSDPTSLGPFDDDLSTWFEDLRRSGVLERTAVVVVGDHGPSYGPRRHTVLGKAEERLPLLGVSVPPWFAAQHSAKMRNLAENSDQLVTPLDLHRTLLALLDINQSTAQVTAEIETNIVIYIIRRLFYHKTGGTAAAAPPPFRPGNPALYGSLPLAHIIVWGLAVFCVHVCLLCVVFFVFCRSSFSTLILLVGSFDL